MASGLVGGRSVLLMGPAGIGKTSVLHAALERVPGGARVLRGRGTQLEAALPFGVAHQILAPVLDGGLDVSTHLLASDVLHGRAAGAEEGAAVAALSWLLLACAKARPTLVLVDDLHWADEESLRWLHHVALRIGGARLAILLAAREPGATPLVGEMTASIEQDGHVERLEPLDLSSVRLLAKAHLPSADDEMVLALHAASGGVPLLVGDLLSELGRRVPERAEPSAELVARLAPEDLQRRISRRLAALGPDATALAQGIATCGDQPGALALGGRVAELMPDVVTRTADLLRHEGLLDHEYRPVHPVLLRAVLAAAGPHRREELHARAARILHLAGAKSPIVALHLGLAGPVGEPWTTQVLVDAAADASRRGALASAAGLLQRALQEEGDGPRRDAITLALAGALITQGDAEGVAHLLQLAESSPPEQALALRLRAVLPLAMSGQAWRVPQLLPLPDVDAPDEDLDQSFAIVVLRALAAMFGSGEPAGPVLRQGLRVARKLPEATDDALRRGRFGQLALGLCATDTPAGEIAWLARRSMTPPDTHRADAAAGLAVPGAAWAAALAEHDEQADGALERIEVAARRRGALSIGLVSTLGARAGVALQRGDLVRAEADARLALTFAGVAPLRNLAYARLALAGVLVERGELDEARALACDPPQDIVSAVGTLAAARILLAEGRHEETMTLLDAIQRMLEQSDVDGGPMIPWREVRSEALRALGRYEEAATLGRELRRCGENAGLPGTEAAGARLEGLATGDIEALRHAVKVAARSTRRLEHGRCLLALGGALRRSGARRDARPFLTQALETATRSTATVLAANAADELRRAGARPRSALRTGADALSPSERRVAELVAKGHTNREVATVLYVSIKTVESQLRSVFRKLDITSRAEIAPRL